MSANKTPFVQYPPLILLVALRDDVARSCATAVTPLPTMRAASVLTAIERLPIVRPLVVIVSDEIVHDELTLLTERTSDVVAELVRISTNEDHQKLVARLKTAVIDAITKRA